MLPWAGLGNKSSAGFRMSGMQAPASRLLVQLDSAPGKVVLGPFSLWLFFSFQGKMQREKRAREGCTSRRAYLKMRKASPPQAPCWSEVARLASASAGLSLERLSFFSEARVATALARVCLLCSLRWWTVEALHQHRSCPAYPHVCLPSSYQPC